MNDEVVPDELTILKERADRMGINYHPSIGVEKLREKISAALSTPSEDQAPVVAASPLSEEAIRQKLIQDATKLIRIRITCMNPFKKDWEGEIFTVSNSVVGTIKKYVPFNADNGWHVPQMLLNMLQERHCQVFYNEKSKMGVTVRKGKLMKEFAIEILPPLDKQELKDLAQQQAVANRIG